MPELLEQAIATSDRTVTVDLLDGSTVTVELDKLADYVNSNKENIKFHKFSHRGKRR
jgi:hypothetical protein